MPDSRLLEAACDPLGRTSVMLVAGPQDRPVRCTRLRLLLGKGRRGWARVYGRDAALEGFDCWCSAYGLPIPPRPELGAPLDASADEMTLGPVAVTTAEEFHLILRHAVERATARRAAKNEYETSILPRFLPPVRRELEQLRLQCMRLALGSHPLGQGRGIASPGEIARQVETDASEGALLAALWLGRCAEVSGLNEGAVRDVLMARLHLLWGTAIATMRSLDLWDSVTEHVWKIAELTELPGLAANAAWPDLSADERLQISNYFLPPRSGGP